MSSPVATVGQSAALSRLITSFLSLRADRRLFATFRPSVGPVIVARGGSISHPKDKLRTINQFKYDERWHGAWVGHPSDAAWKKKDLNRFSDDMIARYEAERPGWNYEEWYAMMTS